MVGVGVGVIIGDAAPGFVFWWHHTFQLSFFWFPALGDTYSCPPLLINLQEHKESGVYSGRGRMFPLQQALAYEHFSDPRLSALTGGVCSSANTFASATMLTRMSTLNMNKLHSFFQGNGSQPQLWGPSCVGILGYLSLSGDSTYTHMPSFHTSPCPLVPNTHTHTHTFLLIPAWPLTPLRINMCNSGEILHYHGNRASCPIERRTANCTAWFCVPPSPLILPVLHDLSMRARAVMALSRCHVILWICPAHIQRSFPFCHSSQMLVFFTFCGYQRWYNLYHLCPCVCLFFFFKN